jgi:hypothetical protein
LPPPGTVAPRTTWSRFRARAAGHCRANPLTLGSSISIPVTGEFRYCRLKSARGIYNDCSQVPHEQILDYHLCISDRVMMTFTKRYRVSYR